jgi:hypothetical protein
MNAGLRFGLPTARLALAKRLVDLVLSLSICVFVTDLSLLCVCFGARVLAHAGYAIDVFVVGVSAYAQITGGSATVRLLGVLRAWRGARLFWRKLADVDAARSEAEVRLAESQEEVAHLRLLLDQRIQGAAKESEARKHVESMMQRYKSEVEMLREALQIAAETVAQATRPEAEDASAGLVRPDATGTGSAAAREPKRIVVGESGSYTSAGTSRGRGTRRGTPTGMRGSPRDGGGATEGRGRKSSADRTRKRASKGSKERWAVAE